MLLPMLSRRFSQNLLRSSQLLIFQEFYTFFYILYFFVTWVLLQNFLKWFWKLLTNNVWGLLNNFVFETQGRPLKNNWRFRYKSVKVLVIHQLGTHQWYRRKNRSSMLNSVEWFQLWDLHTRIYYQFLVLLSFYLLTWQMQVQAQAKFYFYHKDSKQFLF